MPRDSSRSSLVRDADWPIFLRTVIGTVMACTCLALLVAAYLMGKDRIGIAGLLGLVLAGVVVGVLVGLLMHGAIGAAAGGLVTMLSGSGNIRPAASFSLQEALVMQGKHQEAADAYRRHLATNPADHDARLALADLLVGPMAHPAEAEREFLAVRAGGASERQEFVAAQALIDLYAATGQRGKHMAELARFAERYRGTVDGAAAKRVLIELKDADRQAD